MTMESNLLAEKHGDALVVTVNRPQKMNAINASMLGELDGILDAVADGKFADSRAMIITGAGEKAFVAGADIAAMREFSPEEARRFVVRALAIFRKMELLPLPVIAAVNGYAFGGGCELALACDWILASERAVFGQPEAVLGVIPGFGGSQRLPRLVGRGFALEMICTGRRVAASEAVEKGLANKMCAPESLMKEAIGQASQIASQSPHAVALAKRAVIRAGALDLETACAMESEIFAQCFSHPHQREGMSAFAEKRKPNWSG